MYIRNLIKEFDVRMYKNCKRKLYERNFKVLIIQRMYSLICCITKTRLFKYIENFTIKNWKFSDKNSDIYHISAQNIDCEYSLEPPRRGGSNEYPQSKVCFPGALLCVQDGFRLILFTFFYLAVPAKLDVVDKALIIGGAFLIVSFTTIHTI